MLNFFRVLCVFGLVLFGASQASAGSITFCKKPKVKYTRCVAVLPHGAVGDIVEVKNLSNYIVASGKIVKRKGRSVEIVVGKTSEIIRSKFQVVLSDSDNVDHWTATTAPF